MGCPINAIYDKTHSKGAHNKATKRHLTQGETPTRCYRRRNPESKAAIWHYTAVNCECLVFRFGMFLAVTINAFIIFIIHIIFIIFLVFLVFVVFVVFLDVISCIVIVVFAVLKMFVANLVPNVIHVRFSKAKGRTTRTREDGGIG